MMADVGTEAAGRPIEIRDRLHRRMGAVRGGMRVSCAVLGMMVQVCRQSGSQLLVVLIPTKGSVFAEYVAVAHTRIIAFRYLLFG